MLTKFNYNSFTNAEKADKLLIINIVNPFQEKLRRAILLLKINLKATLSLTKQYI